MVNLFYKFISIRLDFIKQRIRHHGRDGYDVSSVINNNLVVTLSLKWVSNSINDCISTKLIETCILCLKNNRAMMVLFNLLTKWISPNFRVH